MNEKIECFDSLLIENNQSHNKYVIDVINKHESQNKAKVENMRKEMMTHLLKSNLEISEYMKTDSCMTDGQKWFHRHYSCWRNKLQVSVESEDEKRLIAAILYEQATNLSIEKSAKGEKTVSQTTLFR